MEIKDYLIFLLIFLMLFAIGIYLKPILKPRSSLVSPAGRATHYMEIMSKYLAEYYDRTNASDQVVEISDIVSFLESDCGEFSRKLFSQKPITFNEKYDFGIFLILPNKLISDAPTIIAYTTPLEKDKRFYRIALFLNGTNISIVPIENYFFEDILDIRKLEDTPKPYFYYCRTSSKIVKK